MTANDKRFQSQRMTADYLTWVSIFRAISIGVFVVCNVAAAIAVYIVR